MSVLGSGSVGLAIAATYAQAGLDITLLARGAVVPELRHGIMVSGDHRIGPQRLKVSAAANPDREDIACDVLVVAPRPTRSTMCSSS